MEIITEELGSETNSLDGTEFVKPKSTSEYHGQIASGNESLTFGKNCLVYRNIRSRQMNVKIVPIKNIDFFSIQTRRSVPLLSLGIFLLFLSALMGLLIYFFSVNEQLVFFSQPSPSALAQLKLFWPPLISLLCGIIVLMVYAFRRRAELIIWTRSANNKLKIFLSPNAGGSLERFVAYIEAHVRQTEFSE
jgi:hypothetical protein